MIDLSDNYTKSFEAIFSQKIERDVLPSTFAEENRVIPQGEPIPGHWSYDNSPLTKEIVDVLHPDNHIRYCAIMKSAQYGVSDGVIHNGIIYLMKHSPGPILLTAGDGDLITKAMGERIPGAIRGAGLYELIRPNNQRKGKGRSSGDTLVTKQFPGGGLTGQTIQSLNKMRQTTYKIGFLDDFESAVLTNEQRDGDVFAVVKARFTRYADQMKVFLISTPTLKEVSKIEPAFLQGDQRYWFMPCPRCHVHIRFEMFSKKNEDKYGLLYDLEDDKVVPESIRYCCQNCGGNIKETEKLKMIRAGQWQATAKPKNNTYRSYHISDLYSTFGTSWFDLCEEWHDATKDKSKLKAFLNLRLGQTYEESRQEVKSMVISRNTREYEIGTIPNRLSNEDGNGDICLITMACDLAGHIGEDETNDDVRLDYEILGHSISGATYSIDAGYIGSYKVGKDYKKNINRTKYTYRHGHFNSVWTKLDEILNKEYLTDDGNLMEISICVIDTGHATSDVYEYLDLNSGVCFGVKGESERKIISDHNDAKLFKPLQERSLDCFLITGSIIKDRLAQYMKKSARHHPQEPNTMNFPQPAAGKYTVKGYFNQYEAEVKKPKYDAGGILKGYVWDKRHSGSDDHYKDCRVYNLFARDIYVWLYAKWLKESNVKIDVNTFYWSNFCNYKNHA